MRKLVVIAALLLLPASAWGAAYVTTGAGNWSDQTKWALVPSDGTDGNDGVPDDGDTATLSHAINTDTNTAIGNSPNDTTTFVLTIASGGSLAIPTGVILTCKGNLDDSSTQGTGIAINGTGKLEFDGSAIGVDRDYKLYIAGSTSKVVLAGTDANNRATITAKVGGGCWYEEQGLYDMQSMPSISYGLLQRWGDTTRVAMQTERTIAADNGQTVSITNTLFDQCNAIRLYCTHVGGIVTFTGNVFQSSPASTWCLYFDSSANGTSTCSNNVFDNGLYVERTHEVVVANNYCGSSLRNSNLSTGWKTGSGNNLSRNNETSGVAIYGGLSNCYFVHDFPDGDNYYYVDTNATADGQAFTDLVHDFTDTSPILPDGFHPYISAGRTLSLDHILVLPDSAGVSSGAWANIDGNVGGNVSITHCTAPSVGVTGTNQTGVWTGETPIAAGTISDFKSNLIWTPVGKTGGFKLVRSQNSTVQDHAYAEDCDYNWGWALGDGSEGGGYDCRDTGAAMFSSGTPDIHGGIGDPGFVDSTRNLVRFDIDYLGNAAATAWSGASVSYVIGDVVSNSDATYFAGDTINFRCIIAHTSGASTEPGVGASWRTNWEPMSLYRLREDVTRIAELKTWVKAGFRPTNYLVRTGHDAATIGALDYLETGTYTLAAPSPASGRLDTASGNFTIALAANQYPGSMVVTPAANIAGTFTPATVTLTDADRSKTFTFTPSATGTATITTTNDGSMTNPAGVEYEVTAGGGAGRRVIGGGFLNVHDPLSAKKQ